MKERHCVGLPSKGHPLSLNSMPGKDCHQPKRVWQVAICVTGLGGNELD